MDNMEFDGGVTNFSVIQTRSSPDNNSICSESPSKHPLTKVIFIAILPYLLLTGILGNFLSIYIQRRISREQARKNPRAGVGPGSRNYLYHVYLVHISWSNLIVCGLCTVIVAENWREIITRAPSGSEIWVYFYAKYLIVFVNGFFGASVYILGLMLIERCYSIIRPFHHSRTQRSKVLAALPYFIYIFANVLSTPIYFWRDVCQCSTYYNYNLTIPRDNNSYKRNTSSVGQVVKTRVYYYTKLTDARPMLPLYDKLRIAILSGIPGILILSCGGIILFYLGRFLSKRSKILARGASVLKQHLSGTNSTSRNFRDSCDSQKCMNGLNGGLQRTSIFQVPTFKIEPAVKYDENRYGNINFLKVLSNNCDLLRPSAEPDSLSIFNDSFAHSAVFLDENIAPNLYGTAGKIINKVSPLIVPINNNLVKYSNEGNKIDDNGIILTNDPKPIFDIAKPKFKISNGDRTNSYCRVQKIMINRQNSFTLNVSSIMNRLKFRTLMKSTTLNMNQLALTFFIGYCLLELPNIMVTLFHKNIKNMLELQGGSNYQQLFELVRALSNCAEAVYFSQNYLIYILMDKNMYSELKRMVQQFWNSFKHLTF